MNNIRIGFYLKNSRISSIDCRDIDKGNPGIGGTFFSMISLISNLSKRQVPGFFIKTYAESATLLPSVINAAQINSLNELICAMGKDRIDILVVNRINELDANPKLFNALAGLSAKVIVWAHCFIPPKQLRYYTQNEKVSRVVCVGREQLGLLVDHKIFKKSTFIFNGVNIDNIPENYSQSITPFNLRPNEVTYIGSISPHKGFHLLAKAWKKVLIEIPDAKLNVIGSGQLYDRKSKLGKFGIAEKYYEQSFIKNILDTSGKVHSSIRFLGIRGSDKFEILLKTKVGIPNPSGMSETFGYTAVEMQLAGCMVVTKKCPGYLDTVYKESGILIDKSSQLANEIIRLLQKKDYDFIRSINFIRKNFSYDVITLKWINLFQNVFTNNICDNDLKKAYRYKRTNLRKINKKIKTIFPFAHFLPSILYFEDKYDYLLHYISLLMNLRSNTNKFLERYLFSNKK